MPMNQPCPYKKLCICFCVFPAGLTRELKGREESRSPRIPLPTLWSSIYPLFCVNRPMPSRVFHSRIICFLSFLVSLAGYIEVFSRFCFSSERTEQLGKAGRDSGLSLPLLEFQALWKLKVPQPRARERGNIFFCWLLRERSQDLCENLLEFQGIRARKLAKVTQKEGEINQLQCVQAILTLTESSHTTAPPSLALNSG